MSLNTSISNWCTFNRKISMHRGNNIKFLSSFTTIMKKLLILKKFFSDKNILISDYSS